MLKTYYARQPMATRLEPHVVPTPDLCDAPFRCLRINSEWASHIAGAIQSLIEPDAWAGTEAEIYRAQQTIERISDMLAIPCPNDEETLVTQISYESTVSNMNGQYNGTPGSINPDAPADAFDQDATDTPAEAQCRGNSLCAVVSALVNTLLNTEQQRRSIESNFLSLSAYALGAMALIPGIGAYAVAAITLSSLVLGALGVTLGGLSNAILADTAARAEVICCLLNNLYGKANTPANLAASCSPCGCFTNPNSQTILDAICGMFADPTVYLMFQELLARAQKGCADGLLDPCLCEDWCAVWDFSVNNGNWGQSVIGSADYVAGQYWNRHDYVQIGQASERRCWIRRGFSSHAITFLEVTYDYTLGYQDPPDIAPDQSLYVNLSTDLHKPFGELQQGVSRVIRWGGCVTASEIDIRLTCSKDFTFPEQYGGDARIHKVVMKGRGTFPFETQYLCP